MGISKLYQLTLASALLWLATTEAKQHDGAKDINTIGEGESNALFRDDESFWSRFVEEVVSSSFTSPPTTSPTSPPTEGPTEPPTTSPTEPPTPPPTPGPTDPPTPAPTEPPTTSPSEPPTAPPTLTPSEPPTPGVCLVQTILECLTADGDKCQDIVQPDGQCSIGEDIEIVTFLLNFCTCDESLNTQDGACSDSGALPSGSELVSVTCVDPNSVVLFSDTVAGGSDVVIGSAGTALPEALTCSVSSTDGTLLQTVTIDTSGQVNLVLKDKFGSFELLSCDDQNCIQTLTYTFTTSNTGDITSFITEWERIRNGETINLLPLADKIEINPGEVSTATETLVIDVCIDAEYLTSVSVIAETLSGVICPAQASDFFETVVGCKVDVEIMCESEFGVMCEDLESPPGICSDGDDYTELRFRLRLCTCEESYPTNTQPDALCNDVNPFPTGAMALSCSDGSGTDLIVIPPTVFPDDAFTVSVPGGGAFPDEITCEVSSPQDSTLYQVVNLDTSGEVELKLKDKFGSLELEACRDVTGEQLDCLSILCYLYSLENVGTNDMDITLLERTRDGVTEQLLDLLPTTSLAPGESTSVIEKEVVDLCVQAEYSTEVEVEADPPEGSTCFAQDEFEFEVIPPCDIKVEMDCVTLGGPLDGIECVDLVGEQFPECQCPDDCVTGIVMRYTAAGCGDGEASCIDSAVSATSASVLIQSGGTTFFDGAVQVGDDITISDGGNCLPSDFDVTILEANSQVVSQVNTIDVSCAGENTLLDEYGALQFSGYLCEDQVPHICYADVQYTVTTTNSGVTEQTVTGCQFLLNGELVPPGALPILAPKESFTKVEPAEIELCIDGQYDATVVVTAENPEGVPCEDTGTLSFDIVVGSPFPSPSPSAPPSPAPSASPSEPPSPSPSIPPTDVPSAPPSPSPSASPSAPPSPSPTGSPTASPSDPPSPSPSASPSEPPSPSPSASPSEPPSPSPSASPSEPPSPSPSIPPTIPPSGMPTEFPSPSPSASPSAPPSPSPTESPSEPPSPSPSAPPSPSPSSSPTESPTVPPNSEPSASPTGTPTETPSVFPTIDEPCEFDLDITCVPPPGSANCNATPPPVTQCTGRPFEMIFLYNGGNCDQSFNIQGAQNLFFCTDFDGGPPTERGTESWILVTDLGGDTIYHSDWVEVGSLFTLTDGGNRFEANQLITIFNSSDLIDANVIQSVQYHSSCSSNLFLKDRFGSVQLVVWVNEDQGTISCFANQTFELDITIPIDIEGGPATITSLTVASNVEPRFFNLTDSVAGTVVPIGGTLQTDIQIPIDLTRRITYQLLITVIAITRLGEICQATELTSFTAGYPLPPLFPTFAPTQAPTGTSPPTRDPNRVPCNLQADINCASSSGRSCRRLEVPQLRCIGDEDPTLLQFFYTGLPCNDSPGCSDENGGLNPNVLSPSYLFVQGRRDDFIFYDGVVNPGQFVTLTGPYDREVEVVISSVVGNGPGTELQSLRIDVECNDADLEILRNYGALQLSAFSNSVQGYQGAFEQITITYVVENEGSNTALLSSAIGSDFAGTPSELVADGGQELTSGEVFTHIETSLLFLFEHAGNTFSFDLAVEGEGLLSGRQCSDSTNYFFTVAA